MKVFIELFPIGLSGMSDWFAGWNKITAIGLKADLSFDCIWIFQIKDYSFIIFKSKFLYFFPVHNNHNNRHFLHDESIMNKWNNSNLRENFLVFFCSFGVELALVARSTLEQKGLGLIPFHVLKLSSPFFLTMDCEAYSCIIIVTCYIWCPVESNK